MFTYVILQYIYIPIYKNIYAHIPKQQTYCDMSCLGRVPSWDVRNGICNYALKGKWLVFSKHEGKKKKRVECFQNCLSQEQNAIGQLTCLCSSPSAWLSCMPGVLLFFPLKVSYNSSLEKKTCTYLFCLQSLWGDEFEIWAHYKAEN